VSWFFVRKHFVADKYFLVRVRLRDYVKLRVRTAWCCEERERTSTNNYLSIIIGRCVRVGNVTNGGSSGRGRAATGNIWTPTRMAPNRGRAVLGRWRGGIPTPSGVPLSVRERTRWRPQSPTDDHYHPGRSRSFGGYLSRVPSPASYRFIVTVTVSPPALQYTGCAVVRAFSRRDVCNDIVSLPVSVFDDAARVVQTNPGGTNA